MTERLPGDFGANWSTPIVVIVLVGLVVVAAGTFYLPIWSAQRAVAERLIDPSSVMFRDVHRGKDAICGEANAKNKFGGYVGFTRFIVTGIGQVFIDGPDDPSASKRWPTYC